MENWELMLYVILAIAAFAGGYRIAAWKHKNKKRAVFTFGPVTRK